MEIDHHAQYNKEGLRLVDIDNDHCDLLECIKMEDVLELDIDTDLPIKTAECELMMILVADPIEQIHVITQFKLIMCH